MKYLSEYRNANECKRYLELINEIATQNWNIMEICGGQTHSLVKNGIIDLLPQKIKMIHGPGCPVCVTPQSIIDEAVKLSTDNKNIICSFGDMLRVPGSSMSLLDSKSKGADIRIVYSPLDAVQIAKKNPLKEIIFLAVGFETTSPANALSVIRAEQLKLSNYSILTSQVLVPPAMSAILEDNENIVDAFLAAGHVCSIMGVKDYENISTKYKVPIVVTGFEPVDLLQGILMTIIQLENSKHIVENQYKRAVLDTGNHQAIKIINQVFEIGDKEWRGIGIIEKSGLKLSDNYSKYDATKKFNLKSIDVQNNSKCIAGDILRGLKKPKECPEFGINCVPEFPLGAPMVSSEGACAAYFHFS